MIRIEGSWLKDEQGRTLLLRGINLSGSSKVPCRPNGAMHIRERFFSHRDVSFVGRPFPLAEAGEHLARLREWGFTFLRLLVTWEAVAHAGPTTFDLEYLSYLREVVDQARAYGFHVLIDPHQDVWSRFSGGDGAPGWTFEAVGMDIRGFAETGAAVVHATYGDPLPRMIWPTNYDKLAAATMFSLFFGGDDFAPQAHVEGVPVQEYLQQHYCAAFQAVAESLKGLPNVMGYEPMNEPSLGFIGVRQLDRLDHVLLRLGPQPTPFQGMQLGDGIPQQVEVWDMRLPRPRIVERRWLNGSRTRAWLPGHECIWRQNGVWNVQGNQPVLLRPDHFAQVDGQPVDASERYLRPFAARFADAIRTIDPGAIIFLEGEPVGEQLRWGPRDAPQVVHAPHWYDSLTLLRKRFVPFVAVDAPRRKLVFGRQRVRRALAAQVAGLRTWSENQMGRVPTLIGEFGIPFDMHGKRAYRTGDYRRQVQALDASYRAIEDNLVSYALWNYTCDNNNERGDQWNGEDLSIFSRDQQADADDVNSGGRALEAAIRPHASRIAGRPVEMTFDRSRRRFELVFCHDPAVEAPTEVYVPRLQYPGGYAVEVSDGTYQVDDETQTLRYRHEASQELHWLRVLPRRT